MVVASFGFFLLLFVGIGIYSSFQAKKTTNDYLLAGQDVSPWLVALSAVSTNNSGYMFIGQIGYTYMNGLSSIWIMIGWLAGDFFGSMLVHEKLRKVSEKRKAMSFGELIAGWHGHHYPKVRILVGFITIIFLCIYAAAQFKAGSKALHVLFGWDQSAGSIIGAIVVFIYCMAGGIRASIWTDAAQSIVMVFSMGLLLFMAISDVGGLSQTWNTLDTVTPTFTSLFPDGGFTIFALLFVVGWFFAGLGVVGQPHVMIRFMTLDRPSSMNKVRFYYYSWFILFYIMAIGVGLLARVLIPEVAGFDAEMALPTLSVKILPDILVGVMLAGIFSATMSTADSQILSCTASVSRDISSKGYLHGYWGTKFTTLAVTLTALLFALWGPDSVFQLVLMAWSFLASAFGPILILYAFNKQINQAGILIMILSGGATAIIWRELGLNSIISECAPGMIAGFCVFFIYQLFSRGLHKKA